MRSSQAFLSAGVRCLVIPFNLILSPSGPPTPGRVVLWSQVLGVPSLVVLSVVLGLVVLWSWAGGPVVLPPTATISGPVEDWGSACAGIWAIAIDDGRYLGRIWVIRTR